MLLITQSERNKVKHIKYEQTQIQNYLKSSMTNRQKSLLFSLRSRMVRTIKGNFQTMYNSDIKCPLCHNEEDTQEHCLNCEFIIKNIDKVKEHIKYNHLFGSIQQQIEATKYFEDILQIRLQFEDNCLPGQNFTGPIG